MSAFADRTLGAEPDVVAPDTSEIRLLAQTSRASSCHARLLGGTTTRAVRHRTVDETWFCTAGTGELWRRFAGVESVVALRPGVSVALPCGTAFQWRALGDESLDVVIATVPPWPGPDEAEFVAGRWSDGGVDRSA